MVAIAESFVPNLLNCNEILNAGSLLLVAPVVCPNDEPIVHTLTVDTATTATDTSITLTSDITEGTRLRKGAVLHFGADVVTVTAETLVTTATVVPTEEIGVIIADTTTATTWALLQILSPTNIPTNVEAQEVNRTDLSNGLQGGMVKVKIEYNPQVTVINRTDDRALLEYLFPASFDDTSVFSFIVRSSGIHTFGRCLVSGYNDDGNIEEISRPQFTLKHQPPFAIATLFQYLSTEKQTELNNARKLAGLNELVAV